MPEYQTMPSLRQWRSDVGLTGIFKSKEFPALERICDLVDLYHQLAGVTLAQREVLLQIWRHTRFVWKWQNSAAKVGKVSTDQAAAVGALNRYVLGYLGGNSQELLQELGREVTQAGQEEDALGVQINDREWFEDAAIRKTMKLSFRNGLAHRWTFVDGVKGTLELYDTRGAHDNVEPGQAGIYVMDMEGRLYTAGGGSEKHMGYRHSSFLAGAKTLAAGTIKIELGRIKFITGASGHYQPTVQQMVNVLERLRSYQVDLTNVMVCRQNFLGSSTAGQYPAYWPAWMLEPCMATQLLSLRCWPTDRNNPSMKVGEQRH